MIRKRVEDARREKVAKAKHIERAERALEQDVNRAIKEKAREGSLA